MTVENLDLDKLSRDPELFRLFTDTMKKATVRDPDGNNASAKDDQVVVRLSKGNASALHEVFTAQPVKWNLRRLNQYNASVVVSIAVHAERGIGFATASLLTTGRFKLASNVAHHLRMLQSRFVPVMPLGSELFVSAVSPIMAFGHDGISEPSSAQMADEEARHIGWQEILAKVGGQRTILPTVCLFTALIVCISVPAAMLQRQARRKRKYAPLMAESLFSPIDRKATRSNMSRGFKMIPS